MNFINKYLLRLAMLPKGLYKKMGVNTAQLQAILETKLLIDNRRPFALRSMGRQQKKETNNSSVTTVLFSLLMGAIYCFGFSQSGLELQLLIYFSMLICMLAAMLITDFTSVLIDVRDNFIILPKPVNDQTIALSRVLHILLHLFKIVVPMILPGTIAVAAMYGAGTMLAFFLMALLCTPFTLFLINLIYVLILKLVSPERFKTVISFVQIILTIIVYGSFQIIPRIIVRMNFDLTALKYVSLIPSFWFAAGVKMLTAFSGSQTEIVATVSAFVVPFVSFYIMIKFLAPSFNRKIVSINTSVTDTLSKTPVNTGIKRHHKKSYADTLASILIKDKIEKGAFLFSWKVGSRSRDFYMKVYPAIGYIIVMFFVLMLGNSKLNVSDFSQPDFNSPVLKKGLMYLVYCTGYLLFVVMAQIIFSDKYKAAWLFYTTPIQLPGKILSGALKSIIAKFYFPVMLVVTAFATCFFKWHLLPNVLLAFSNVVLIVSTMFYAGSANFPFSVAQNMDSKGTDFMKNMLRLILMAVAGVLQYFIFSFTAVIIICLALSLSANWLLMNRIGKISWQKIIQSEI